MDRQRGQKDRERSVWIDRERTEEEDRRGGRGREGQVRRGGTTMEQNPALSL